MKLFDPVVIACDPTALELGQAIRAALEAFRLRVTLYHCVQKRNVLDVLAGRIPDSEYVVLCAHGWNPTEGDETKVSFRRLVDEIDGHRREVEFALTAEGIAELVSLADRTVIAGGCWTGDEALARAFLDAGCTAYIGPEGFVDQDAVVMFTIAFFYHLLSPERDADLRCDAEEAARRAAAIDTQFAEGTGLFRYYGEEKG